MAGTKVGTISKKTQVYSNCGVNPNLRAHPAVSYSRDVAADGAEGGGLRARKKARTRAHIAATAARLFGEHGYERVAIADVATTAEVSEQTVYNYFPTKRDLVLDRDDELRDRMTAQVRDRDSGTSPAAAVRPVINALIDGIATIPPDELRGSVGHLAATSPAIRRLCLESTDRLADSLVTVLASSAPDVDRHRLKIYAIALAWVSQIVIDEAGRQIRGGQHPEKIAQAVRAIVAPALDDLDRWFRSGFARP